MSDIFEIKSVDVKVKYKGVTYPFADPNILQKVAIQKRMKAIQDKKDTVELDVYVTEINSCTKEMVKLYVPSMPDDIIMGMGDCESQALMTALNDLATKNFGAVVEKVTGE